MEGGVSCDNFVRRRREIMSETDINPQGQKPKISKLAAVSPLLSILGFCFLVLILYWEDTYLKYFYSPPFFYYEYGYLISGLIIIAGILIGVLAIKKVCNKGGILKGRGFATAGAVMGVVFLVFWILQFPRFNFSTQNRCAANLRALGVTMLLYVSDYDEKYPTADKWCDLLIEYTNKEHIKKYIRVTERNFKCPANRKKRCSYAINPNVSLSSSPRLVLLFETEGGWNQFGGSEILTFENHREKGCNILFNDITVRFVKKEQLGELEWKDEQKE